MSCDHQFIATHLDAYLQGALDRALLASYETALQQCAQCRDVHQQGLKIQQLAHGWQEQDVPTWHRTRFAVRPPPRNQGGWLNWAAIGLSCCSFLLVIFNFELSTDNGLTISFGARQAEQRLEQQLTAQLAQFRDTNAEQIAEQLDDFSEQQTLTNQLLLAEWMENSRDERRKDLEFVMSTWDAQRYQDRQRTDERLSSLTRNQIESDQYLNELLQNVAYNQRDPL